MKLPIKIRNEYLFASIATAMFFLMLPLICAAQGKILFVTTRDSNEEIYKMNPDGTNQVNLSNHPYYDGDPSFNKHGDKIVFTSYRDLTLEIYTMKADGSDKTRVTNNAVSDTEPAFSPDGSKIVFVSYRDGNAEIYVMNANGSNQTRLTYADGDDLQPTFSADGSNIAFTSHRDGIYNSEIYLMNTNGTNQINLTNSEGYDNSPAYNFDGSKIAFTSTRDEGSGEIYRMNPNGSSPTRLTFNDYPDGQPSYSPDGTKIAFTSYRGPNYEIYVMEADGAFQLQQTFAGVWFESNTVPNWGPKRQNFHLLQLSDLLSPDAEPNVIRAGSSVPIDFSLDGFQGNIIYRQAPASQPIDCSTRRPTGGSEAINRTQPDVIYNTGLDYYTTTWLTQTMWKGTCRRLSLYLDDGTTKMMDFNFK